MKASKNILGIPYSPISFSGAVEDILSYASDQSTLKHSIFTPNVHHLYLFHKNRIFNKAYKDCSMSLIDGMPLVWACRIFNGEKTDRVPGSDIFGCLFRRALQKGMKIYLLGGAKGVAEKAAINLCDGKLPQDQVYTYSPPYDFESVPGERERIIRDINLKSPHLLFVAFGAPRQEIWISENLIRLNVPVALGVGGSFDFAANLKRRAPVWIQTAGFEWLFRLICDPNRLWKRYLITNTFFFWLVLKELVKRLSYPQKRNNTQGNRSGF
jgi:N-acetylglucosaminyldiphosphoundecaprenol N-acetyl-beta-D-mannosaminyltransferase